MYKHIGTTLELSSPPHRPPSESYANAVLPSGKVPPHVSSLHHHRRRQASRRAHRTRTSLGIRPAKAFVTPPQGRGSQTFASTRTPAKTQQQQQQRAPPPHDRHQCNEPQHTPSRPRTPPSAPPPPPNRTSASGPSQHGCTEQHRFRPVRSRTAGRHTALIFSQTPRHIPTVRTV